MENNEWNAMSSQGKGGHFLIISLCKKIMKIFIYSIFFLIKNCWLKVCWVVAILYYLFFSSFICFIKLIRANYLSGKIECERRREKAKWKLQNIKIIKKSIACTLQTIKNSFHTKVYMYAKQQLNFFFLLLFWLIMKITLVLQFFQDLVNIELHLLLEHSHHVVLGSDLPSNP